MTAAHSSYDVVIIGGAMTGSAVAWWLARDPDFQSRILVVERDPSFEFASTSHTNSCIRQQFGSEINTRISLFGAAFIRSFRDWAQDEDAPEIALEGFGYMYLARTAQAEAQLRAAQAMQAACGAGTRLLTPDEIAARFSFYALDDVRLASHNPGDEGYFDGGTLNSEFRRLGRRLGVERIAGEVAGIEQADGRVTHVVLADGTRIAAGWVVNAAGPRAAQIAAMAGVPIPVVPRRRFTFVFEAAEPLPTPLPLTVDFSGVHVRSDGALYMAGCPPLQDDDAAFDDFRMDHDLWEEVVWPAVATRIPAFERVKLRQSWCGHYAMNTLDRNAILGPALGLPNFLQANGFSGHGLQQAPAVGRGIAEWILHGGWRSLDLTPLGAWRISANAPLPEVAVI
ncbi:NAD(P)/FAD-dependent oxidoreductase [Pseudoroseicyclus aestuarii]|uniref:Glycine/D-amino acid oxidase-like deaminating enzyme n=1 Tax=Pseudoroseicyclus aestuarii TaxID=1795041 RepID=A0A318SQ93_9RHOB|nr:FAD-binding oxidoreductase [Pseudoroseicyclus aestuarii]PYE83853.1 glycine/D-amino acid oxidase-like deaminating enzyme [Pseudoroseicyclus aestuarii]